ncbi:hypothetical protein HN682_00425 [Candidatus Peregrinibacteria bacterium]|jgi:hypothetical protein|nr:hypothetical protein [Candidatus Scalindua sp.]MBT7928367.1 hypothetical protein [Candidatus Peregrinibacteria bacterium]
MKNIAIKIFKILITLLIITILTLYSYFFLIDKKNTDFLQGWIKDNTKSYYKSDWEDGFYSRAQNNEYIKLTSSSKSKKAPLFLLISHTDFNPSSVSELWLNKNDGEMTVGLTTYFPHNCSPNSILESTKKYSNGEIITLQCEKNGEWVSTSVGIPLERSFNYTIDLLGFYEKVSVSYEKMNLLRKEYALFGAINKESQNFLGYSEESRANNALTCTGLFYILTANPEPEEVNLLVTKAAIMMSQTYAHLKEENSNSKSLNNGDISSAKDNRALELGELYDKNPDDLVKIYAQCVEIGQNIAIHIENNTPESGSLDWMERRDMYLTTPSANKIEEMDRSTFNVYKNQIDSAMTSWSASDRMTKKDLKKALLDSLK